jgi:hypothetical protein
LYFGRAGFHHDTPTGLFGASNAQSLDICKIAIID